MIRIYHNPRCAKSRAGLKYLESKNIDFEIINYLENPLTVDDLKMILMKLNLKPQNIVRTSEEAYKKELKGKNFTDEEWIRIISQNPKLLMRPIVETKYKAVVAQPPEDMDRIIEDE